MKSNLPSSYSGFLTSLKEKIRLARVKAALSVNTELLRLYWEIGTTVLKQQKQEGWGTKVISRLADDLKREFPDMKGLSERNLKYMRAFAEAYPDFLIVQPLAAQLGNSPFVQPPVAQIPWTHHTIILDKCESQEERNFYIQKTIENGWSKSVLTLQIEGNLFSRQGKAITNFEQTLPAPQSDLAKEAIKNPYILDMLGLDEKIQERDLEKAIIANIRTFLLELGKGFAYVGNQYNLKVEDDEFFLDLLFFNYHLNCFVIIELKVGEFKPEYAGKLNFYINTVDEKIKTAAHKPTIGILLCKTPNKTVVEYSLRGLVKPIGVADYALSKVLPEKLKRDLPSVEELEAELEKDVKKFQKPIDSKLEHLKALIGGLKQPKVKETRSPETTKRILTKVIIPLWVGIKKELAEISKEFEKAEITIWTDNQGHKTDKEAQTYLKEHKSFNECRIEIQLRVFKAAGTKAFYVWKDICIHMHESYYTVNIGRHHPQSILLKEKLYHELLSKKEIQEVIEKFHEQIVDDITQQIERIQNQNK